MQTSELTPERLRALAEIRPERGLVLSLYLNLDPSLFATPHAREREVNSLLDEAQGQVDPAVLEHDEEEAFRADLERTREYLTSGLDADGAHGLALFASGPAGLWETLKLARPVQRAAVVDSRPAIEPLAELADTTRWAVLLVNRNSTRILLGDRDVLHEVKVRDDDVHGQHQQGGWSQGRYERSVEKDVDEHLRASGEDLMRQFQRRAFDALLVGAPEELVPRAEELLHPYLRERLAGRLTVDVEHTSPDEVLVAARPAFEERERGHEAEALDRLRAGVGAGGRAVAGWHDVLDALNEQRVEILLLDGRQGHGPGAVCPRCGWLGTDEEACPVDGTALGRRAGTDGEAGGGIAEAAIEAAVRQSAEVVPLRHHEDALAAHAGVGAVLRF